VSQRTFSPPFKRLKIYSRCIPSDESIDLIMDEIGNDFIEKQFVESNNNLIEIIQSMCNPEDDAGYIFRELLIKLNQNYQKQNEVIGGNEFERIWQSLYVVNWFAAMVAKSRETNIQDLKRKAKKIYDDFKKTEYIEFENANENHTPRYSDLMNFPEYASSIEILSDWYRDASTLSNENSELRKLIIREKLLIEQICENIEKSNNQHLNICYFCKKNFPSDRGKNLKKCDECEGKNKKQWEKENRPKKTSEPDGWIKAFDGNRKLCQGILCNDGYEEVGRPRQVNAEYICRECYRKSLGG
jgi:hypothetical protein